MGVSMQKRSPINTMSKDPAAGETGVDWTCRSRELLAPARGGPLWRGWAGRGMWFLQAEKFRAEGCRRFGAVGSRPSRAACLACGSLRALEAEDAVQGFGICMLAVIKACWFGIRVPAKLSADLMAGGRFKDFGWGAAARLSEGWAKLCRRRQGLSQGPKLCG